MSAMLAIGALALGGVVLGGLGLGASKKAQKTADDAKKTSGENRQMIEQLSERVNGLEGEVTQLKMQNAYQQGLLDGRGQQGQPGLQGMNRQQAAFAAGYGLGLNDGLQFAAPIWNNPSALTSIFNCNSPCDFLQNLNQLSAACPAY